MINAFVIMVDLINFKKIEQFVPNKYKNGDNAYLVSFDMFIEINNKLNIVSDISVIDQLNVLLIKMEN